MNKIQELYHNFKIQGLFEEKPSFLRDIPDFYRNSPKYVEFEKLVFNFLK